MWVIILDSHFNKFSVLVITCILLITVAIFVSAGFFSIEIFRLIFYLIAICFLVFFIILLTGFFGIYGIINTEDNGEVPEFRINFATRLAIKILMPLLLGISALLDYKKDLIRRIYINVNNKYLLSMQKKFRPDKIIVILPHCLQSSQCRYRIRDGLKQCHQCMSCDIGDIKEMINRYGVEAELATGGTSARKTIVDKKPEFVIAVACERDLSSGIMDVKGLPVYGILNQRPNGPCKDTFVDASELEYIIKLFITQ